MSVTTDTISRLNAIPLTTIDGARTTLAAYDDQVKLIVNVASRCGLSPQYEQLEQLQRTYGDRGFTVLARAGVERAGETPTWVSTATSTSHCGAGCTLGDLIDEFGLAVAVGWQSLYADRIYAAWIWDFALAFTFGFACSYPMNVLLIRCGVKEAM